MPQTVHLSQLIRTFKIPWTHHPFSVYYSLLFSFKCVWSINVSVGYTLSMHTVALSLRRKPLAWEQTLSKWMSISV